jgi:hypothetical protein
VTYALLTVIVGVEGMEDPGHGWMTIACIDVAAKLSIQLSQKRKVVSVPSLRQ